MDFSPAYWTARILDSSPPKPVTINPMKGKALHAVIAVLATGAEPVTFWTTDHLVILSNVAVAITAIVLSIVTVQASRHSDDLDAKIQEGMSRALEEALRREQEAVHPELATKEASS